MRHLQDVLPYIVFALILHLNETCQERTHFNLFILDKSLFNIGKECLSYSDLIRHCAPKCFWNGSFMIIIHMQFDFSHLSLSFFSSKVLSSIRGEREAILNARLRSITPRTIKRLSFQDLKLESVIIGI